jgi:hypothetical protein
MNGNASSKRTEGELQKMKMARKKMKCNRRKENCDPVKRSNYFAFP